jgi:hypothetical protein
MDTSKILDIVWEKNNGGYIGFYKPQKKVVFTPSLMKNLAISKMIDIKLISADFNDISATFTPSTWLLFDSISNVDFFGVYTNDEASYGNPSFCIRKSSWNKLEDINNFKNADDKKKYITGETQIISNIFFVDSVLLPEITQLIIEGNRIAHNGLFLQENIQNNLHCDEVKINISDGRFYLNLSYKPNLMNNSVLEDWIIKLRDCINNIPLDIGYLPDGTFRISYELSLFDRLNMFDRF